MKQLMCLLLMILFASCDKEEFGINPYFAEVYPQMLEEIDIECTESSEEFYIYARINGEEFCHDQQKVGEFRFSVSNKFTTASPSFSPGEVYDDARHGLRLSLGDNSKQFNEHFEIYFPDFNLGRDAQKHLDSLINIGNLDVMGKEDVVTPDGSSNVEIHLLESNGGFLNNFLITLKSIDKKTETGGIAFNISSIFGDQEGSYFRFKEVKKMIETDGAYYYMDIEFECNLYHWPQYGYEGLWGEVRDGRIIVKLKLREY